MGEGWGFFHNRLQATGWWPHLSENTYPCSINRLSGERFHMQETLPPPPPCFLAARQHHALWGWLTVHPSIGPPQHNHECPTSWAKRQSGASRGALP